MCAASGKLLTIGICFVTGTKMSCSLDDETKLWKCNNVSIESSLSLSYFVSNEMRNRKKTIVIAKSVWQFVSVIKSSAAFHDPLPCHVVCACMRECVALNAIRTRERKTHRRQIKTWHVNNLSSRYAALPFDVNVCGFCGDKSSNKCTLTHTTFIRACLSVIHQREL